MTTEPEPCQICGAIDPTWCSQFALCIDCGEDHGTGSDGRCRDCNITFLLDSMQCSGCQRMRYRERDGSRAADMAVEIAEAVWGDRCVCDPRPPTVYEVRAAR